MNHLQKKAVKIATDLYGVRVLVRKMKWGGSADYFKRLITISNSLNTAQFMSSIFHELGHIYCYEKRKYPAYHHSKSIVHMTKKEIKAVRLTAWKAEQYVDAWGKREMKKHFPKLKYVSSYKNQDAKRWLFDNFVNIHYR